MFALETEIYVSRCFLIIDLKECITSNTCTHGYDDEFSKEEIYNKFVEYMQLSGID